MPTNKVEPSVLKTASEGEANTKRVRSARKPAEAKQPTKGAEPAKAPQKRASRRKNPTVDGGASAPGVKEADTGLHVSFSTEDISVRAYFIGEHRRSLGLYGDSEGDWLEAERQLRSEAIGIAASLRKK